MRQLLQSCKFFPAALILTVGFSGCRESDGSPRASRAVNDISMLARICEGLNDTGFDLANAHNICELRDAAVTHGLYPKNDLNGEYLLKTPYGEEYILKHFQIGDDHFVEVSADVPENTPNYLKSKMTKRIRVLPRKSDTRPVPNQDRRCASTNSGNIRTRSCSGT